MSLNLYRGTSIALLALVALAFLTDLGAAADKCGIVEKLTQPVAVMRGGSETELTEGGAAFTADVIKAGQGGYAEIKLIDDTLIAVGGNSVVTLTEVQFNVNKTQLHIGIDRGAVWISTGSIGLVNANAVKFTTPNLLVSSGNATLQFEADARGEKLKVQWIPKGGKVGVYNYRSKERATLKEADIILSVSSSGGMTVGAEEQVEPEPEPEQAKPEPAEYVPMPGSKTQTAP
jgi:hypothetical protein